MALDFVAHSLPGLGTSGCRRRWLRTVEAVVGPGWWQSSNGRAVLVSCDTTYYNRYHIYRVSGPNLAGPVRVNR